MPLANVYMRTRELLGLDAIPAEWILAQFRSPQIRGFKERARCVD